MLFSKENWKVVASGNETVQLAPIGLVPPDCVALHHPELLLEVDVSTIKEFITNEFIGVELR